MNLQEFPSDYGTKCGVLYWNGDGHITFHCEICSDMYHEFLEYRQHLIKEHIVKEHDSIKEEDCKSIDAEYTEDALEEYDLEIAFLDTLPEREDGSSVELEESYDSITDFSIFKGNQLTNDENTVPRPNKQLGQIRCKDKNIVRRFKCTKCNFSCKDKSNITGHIKRHSNAKAFQCSACKKDFHTSTELKEHFRRHTGDKPYLCTDCGRAFFTSGLLSAHIKRHKNQRDKECEICRKKFFDSAALGRHSLVHTGHRPFKCTFPECNSSFKRRNALVGHIKMHENKREYQCAYCPARFNQKCNLNSHLRSKHLIACTA